MSETLDKAYLEYSQITKARTEREKSLASQVRWLIEYGGAMRQSFNGGRTADNWDKQVKVTTYLPHHEKQAGKLFWKIFPKSTLGS